MKHYPGPSRPVFRLKNNSCAKLFYVKEQSVLHVQLNKAIVGDNAISCESGIQQVPELAVSFISMTFQVTTDLATSEGTNPLVMSH
jgi:hypothetical protein